MIIILYQYIRNCNARDEWKTNNDKPYDFMVSTAPTDDTNIITFII